MIVSSLNRCKQYECDLAMEYMDQFGDKDLLIYDRGFASYKMLASLVSKNIGFIIRFSKSSFKEVNEMFESGPWSREIELYAPKDTKKAYQGSVSS